MIVELTDLFEQLIEVCSYYNPNSNTNLFVSDDTNYNIKINYYNYTILFFKMESTIDFKFCYEIDDGSSVFASLVTSNICISRFVNQAHYTNLYSALDMILLFVYDHKTKYVYNKVGDESLLNLFIENDIANIYDIDTEMELYISLKGFW